VLLICFAVDEYDCHTVQPDLRAGHDGEGSHSVIVEAMTALEVIRQQFAVMEATPSVRFSERNAFEVGREIGAG
jgi:hypothetical protein